MKKASIKSLITLLSLFCLSLSSLSLMGCKETKELVIIERPKFWSKMTPTQKEFYETLNALQKKRIAAYTSNTEQWDAFMVLWKGYTKRQK